MAISCGVAAFIYLMNFLKRLFGKKNEVPVATLTLCVYDDCVEFHMIGTDVKIGGALVTLMLRNPDIHKIISNAVQATDKEMARLDGERVIKELLTINPN